jgi:hypothetical protein
MNANEIINSTTVFISIAQRQKKLNKAAKWILVHYSAILIFYEMSSV